MAHLIVSDAELKSVSGGVEKPTVALPDMGYPDPYKPPAKDPTYSLTVGGDSTTTRTGTLETAHVDFHIKTTPDLSFDLRGKVGNNGNTALYAGTTYRW